MPVPVLRASPALISEETEAQGDPPLRSHSKLVAEPGPKPMLYPLSSTAVSSRLPDQVHPAL